MLLPLGELPGIKGVCKALIGVSQTDGVVILANSTISQSSSATIKTP
jgi:hypothetical protein